MCIAIANACKQRSRIEDSWRVLRNCAQTLNCTVPSHRPSVYLPLHLSSFLSIFHAIPSSTFDVSSSSPFFDPVHLSLSDSLPFIKVVQQGVLYTTLLEHFLSLYISLAKNAQFKLLSFPSRKTHNLRFTNIVNKKFYITKCTLFKSPH